MEKRKQKQRTDVVNQIALELLEESVWEGRREALQCDLRTSQPALH